MENIASQPKSNVFEMSEFNPEIGMSPERIEAAWAYARSHHPAFCRDTINGLASVELLAVPLSNVIPFPVGLPRS